MSMEMAFTRTLMIKPVLEGVAQYYGVLPGDLGIPERLLMEPMSCVPMPDLALWYEQIEARTGDPLFLLKALEHQEIEALGPVGQWYVSAPDLATTLRRVNYSSNALQSGLSAYGAQSGRIFKWCFDNPFAQGAAKFHDGCRKVMLVRQILRHYPGGEAPWLRLRLPGSSRDTSRLRDHFECDVEVGAGQTEVWMPMELMTRSRRAAKALPNTQQLVLDDLLNMPSHTDIAKAFYEMVNYSRHYGLPSIGFIARRYGLSEQQLQRRLQRFGWSFSSIVSYVLFNQAVRYLQEGMSVSDTARYLGYNNVQSFSKAFARQRGLTPTQYQQELSQRQKSPP
ncbi:AraC family transcriptional regulator [Marinobacter hydrocarbonoclasticus]|nr:AraC family transcriptional regulator [Marinobacter nauticus]